MLFQVDMVQLSPAEEPVQVTSKKIEVSDAGNCDDSDDDAQILKSDSNWSKFVLSLTTTNRFPTSL